MPRPMVTASRFSCLQIEDDSDEDSRPLSASTRQAPKRQPTQRPGAFPKGAVMMKAEALGANVIQLPDGLIVHQQDRTKNKKNKKPNTKPTQLSKPVPVVVEEYDTQLKRALEESNASAPAPPPQNGATASARESKPKQPTTNANKKEQSPSSDSTNSSKEDPLDKILRGTSELQCSLLQSHLAAARDQINTLTLQCGEYESKATKYRDRFRKVLDILQEAELMEKAQLIHEKEQRDSVIADMGQQLKKLQEENEKLRGRLNKFTKH